MNMFTQAIERLHQPFTQSFRIKIKVIDEEPIP